MLAGPIRRGDIPLLCERLCALARENEVGSIDCEVAGLLADLIAVEALARLQLSARRCGCRVRLLGVSRELEALLGLCGLDEVL